MKSTQRNMEATENTNRNYELATRSYEKGLNY